MRRYLLDTDMLLAQAWPTHLHHAVANDWINAQPKFMLGTCALTQSGFLRIITKEAFVRGTGYEAVTMSQALAYFENYRSTRPHQFLELDFEIEAVQQTCTAGLHGHKQITDAYLLTLAIKHDFKLVTLDQGIPSLLRTQAERDKHVILLT